MWQEHRAGEKVFIDYSDGLSTIDLTTGELIPTQLFLAVWGAMKQMGRFLAGTNSHTDRSLLPRLP